MPATYKINKKVMKSIKKTIKEKGDPPVMKKKTLKALLKMLKKTDKVNRRKQS